MSNKKFFCIGFFGVLAFLPFIQYITYKRSIKSMTKCIFCDIARGDVPSTEVEYENNEFIIFKDIKPASKYHYLAVPKRHIESAVVLTKADEQLITEMESGLRKLFISKGIDLNDALFGFHYPPFISVKHLHMHAIAPKSEMGFIGRLVFKAGTYWFKTPEQIHSYIHEKST